MAAVSNAVDGRHTHRTATVVRVADGRRTMTIQEECLIQTGLKSCMLQVYLPAKRKEIQSICCFKK